MEVVDDVGSGPAPLLTPPHRRIYFDVQCFGFVLTDVDVRSRSTVTMLPFTFPTVQKRIAADFDGGWLTLNGGRPCRPSSILMVR